MSLTTSTQGIWQGDVAIRSALLQGIKDLKANLDLLDYCFAWLPNDDLTADEPQLGQTQVDRAKEWFRLTNIPVVLNLHLITPKLPAISIQIMDASEAESTLGDVHYDPQEDVVNGVSQALTPTFSVISYDEETGYIEIPTAILNSILIVPGMVLMDDEGQPHTITEAIDEVTVAIDPAIASFRRAVFKYAQPSMVASLESCQFKGTYRVGVHVQGEPETLMWMRSIIEFILMRYKESYLEGRGFERSTMQITAPALDQTWGMDRVFTQYVTLTGYYRNYWPKAVGLKGLAVIVDPLKIVTGQASPPGTDLTDVEWMMDLDVSSGAANLKGIKG